MRVATVLALLWTAQVHAQTIPERITLRTAQAPPDLVQSVIADLSQNTELKIPENIDPAVVLRSFCGGSFTTSYLQKVLELNPSLQMAPSSKNRIVNLPACPKTKRTVVVTVRPGDTLESMLRRTMGVAPNDVISICDEASLQENDRCAVPVREAVERLNGRDKSGIDYLRPGQKLTLPNATQFTTITLKPGVSSDEAIRQIQEAASQSTSGTKANPIAALYESPELQLIRPLTAEDSRVLDTACAPKNAQPADKWPLDHKALRAALEHGLSAALARKRPIKPTVVRIADTGVLGIGSFFPEQALAVNPKEYLGSPTDQDNNGWRGDRYGIDAARRGDVTPYGDDPNRLHGTEVADLALGGKLFREKNPVIYQLVNLNFSKLNQKYGDTIFVNDSMLSLSVTTHPPEPSIVNFSVGGAQQTPNFIDALWQARVLQVLAVVAAGNDGVDIGDQLMYPASYGGNGSEMGEYIITVGASGPDGKRAAFSNYSHDRVDILAPGCLIGFIGPDGNKAILHGTSIATPIVSLTAAVIRSFGVTNALEVKARIIASADFDRSLEGEVRFGSVLNVERAAALFDDSLRIKGSGHDIHGRWLIGDVADICDGSPPMKSNRVLKIDSYGVWNSKPQLRILRNNNDGKMGAPIICAAKGDGLKFKESAREPIDVPWEKLGTIVPAYFRN